MRRLTLALVCSALAAMVSVGAVAGTATGAPVSVFRGTWTSIDTDGSSQRLDIAGSGRGAYGMTLVDDSATAACGGQPARVVGPGVSDGNTLVMTAHLVCVPGGAVLKGSTIGIEFVYSPADDTLTDQFGVTWSRG